MKSITIISFHEHKMTPWVIEALEIYKKRLEHWVSWQHLMLKPSGLKDRAAAWEQDWKNHHQHKKILNSELWICDERGLQKSSLWWGEQAYAWSQDKKKEVVFLIGPTYGLDPRWHMTGSRLMSLSSLTMTHELALVVLHEQIYRAFTIAHRVPYHCQ